MVVGIVHLAGGPPDQSSKFAKELFETTAPQLEGAPDRHACKNELHWVS